jgi:phenylacetate-CoA ligase
LHPRRRNALTAFVKRAYAHAPAIKHLFDEAGIQPDEIETPADLERVPVTTKDRLIELQKSEPPFGGFLAVPLHSLQRINLSPGPLLEPQGDEEAIQKTCAELFTIAGFKKGDVVINTLSYHLVPAGLLLDDGLRRIGATVVPAGVGNTELQVNLMRDLRVTGFAGTPGFLMTLLKRAEEMGIDPRTQLALTRAFVTAEPYPPALRRVFHEDYRLKTLNVYGTAELGFLAHDCDAQQGLHMVKGLIIQICDPLTGKQVASGESGQVVVTPLNDTYPTIRLGTGDLALFNNAPCGCGRTTPRLTLVGRVGDAIKVRGMFVHPNQLKTAAAKFPALTRLQGVITRPAQRDEFTLRVELAQQKVDRAELEKQLDEAIRNLCRVGVDGFQFVSAGDIPPDAKLLLDERKWD